VPNNHSQGHLRNHIATGARLDLRPDEDKGRGKDGKSKGAKGRETSKGDWQQWVPKDRAQAGIDLWLQRQQRGLPTCEISGPAISPNVPY